MENYYCGDCKYHTDHLSNFKRHFNSQQHMEQVGTEPGNDIVYADYKRKIYCCDECDNVYTTKFSLSRHQSSCKKDPSVKNLEKKIEALEGVIEETKLEIKNKDKQLNKALDIARVNSKTANSSMNILKYAKLHLNDVEPLEQLKGNDVLDVIKYKNPKNKEATNEEYVKTAIHKYSHNIFANFIGDMIIEHYKPKDKQKANIISTDTSRLCFIIMQKIKKKGSKIEQNEWINDKSGKKFTELVLVPLINAVKETLTEFIEFKKKKALNEDLLCLMGKCVELKRDINVDKFTKPILRYVAPAFHFDKLKLLEDKELEDIISSSSSEEDELPKKKIKIKSNKKKSD